MLYHDALGRPAPYARVSLPVLLGTFGVLGLLVGPAGPFWLNFRRLPELGDAAQRPMDRAFIALLPGRSTSAMALLLSLHLGTVVALFLTMPYGKFAHGVYRSAALLKWTVEKRLPNRLRWGAD